MAKVDPNRIITKLAQKLAQQEIDLAIREILIEDAQAEQENPNPVDVSTQSGE
jgi:hypothetical protein